MNSPLNSLYVHVPFCASKCDYCAFYSEASNGEMVGRYLDGLIREMQFLQGDLQPGTIFFGGGTPSLLNLRQWERILQSMERLGWTQPDEWTVECNPATVSLDKARLLKEAGVNRISMGVQSLHEDLLEALGRIHSRDMVFRSYDILREAGFENINLDLMFAIPGQTLEHWRQTLSEVLAMGPEHLACYEVIYEEDTALYARLKAGKIQVDEELAAMQYDLLRDSLAEAGFDQYEVANFARISSDRMPGSVPEWACHHNVNYWKGGDYHALGPSASGHVRGTRTRNVSSLETYCSELEEGRRPLEFSETLPPLEKAGELAAFGLRMTSGWHLGEFQFLSGGYDLKVDWAGEVQRLVDLEYATLTPDRFALTQDGLRYADWAAELFLR